MTSGAFASLERSPTASHFQLDLKITGLCSARSLHDLRLPFARFHSLELVFYQIHFLSVPSSFVGKVYVALARDQFEGTKSRTPQCMVGPGGRA